MNENDDEDYDDYLRTNFAPVVGQFGRPEEVKPTKDKNIKVKDKDKNMIVVGQFGCPEEVKPIKDKKIKS